jgi:hypothetical protein
MILANVLLGAVYLLLSFNLWNIVNNWLNYGVGSEWSPLIIHYAIIKLPQPYPSLPTVRDQYNSPFILFFITLVVNIYFIIRLGRSKETKTNV